MESRGKGEGLGGGRGLWRGMYIGVAGMYARAASLGEKEHFFNGNSNLLLYC